MASKSETKKVFNLKVDVLDLDAQFRDMNTALKTAVAGTLNVVGRAINKEIAGDIKKNYNIKAKSLVIGKTVRLFRADARKDIPTFTISILKKGRGLALYSARRTQAGISVKVKRGRKTIKGTFFIKNKRGMKFVARKSKKGGFVDRVSRTGKRYKGAKSEFLYGPSLAQLYRRRNSFRLISRVIKRDYSTELNKQFNQQFELKKRR
jgi:hypothetical protein